MEGIESLKLTVAKIRFLEDWGGSEENRNLNRLKNHQVCEIIRGAKFPKRKHDAVSSFLALITDFMGNEFPFLSLNVSIQ